MNPDALPSPELIPRFGPHLFPYHGWALTLPGGTPVSSPTREGLEAIVAQKLGLSAEKAEDFVDWSLCERYPSLCSGGKAKRNITLSPADLSAGFLANLAARDPDAPRPASITPEVVEARLKICAGCPHNNGLVAPGCCGKPGSLAKTAAQLGERLGVPTPLKDGWCKLTGVCITLAAHTTTAFIDERDAIHDHAPDTCPYLV